MRLEYSIIYSRRSFSLYYRKWILFNISVKSFYINWIYLYRILFRQSMLNRFEIMCVHTVGFRSFKDRSLTCNCKGAGIH